MERKELESCVVSSIQRGLLGKPDLVLVKQGDQPLIVKDVKKKNFFYRWTLGLWMIHWEWKIYCRLNGIRGIPRSVNRVDRFAFAIEFIPGQPIHREAVLPPHFFAELERILKEVHARGVVHLDLRHKGNILISETGDPVLIDFNSSLCLKNGLLLRFLFPVLRWVDRGGLLKLKQRVAPSSMTAGELESLKRINRLRKLWIFN